MKKKMSRREFFKTGASIGFASFFAGKVFSSDGTSGYPFVTAGDGIDISVAVSSDAYKNTREAIKLLGGIEKFVPKNSKVAILPNSQSNHPGTYTKQAIVEAVIDLCKEAGAQEINCLSWLPKKFWDATGLGEAVINRGANFKLIDMKDETQFVKKEIPQGIALKETMVVKEYYNNDVFITIPIMKDHAGNKFTGTMKNFMACDSPVSNKFFHSKDIAHLDQCIADLNTILSPTLCVVDAMENITTNGPFGPGELIKPNKVVAGVDRVAIDSYCTTLLGMQPTDIIMIKRAYEHKLGEIDLTKVNIKETSV
jgi:uncharacterized protein (DUF362 family)